jgi:hypothetical protein
MIRGWCCVWVFVCFLLFLRGGRIANVHLHLKKIPMVSLHRPMQVLHSLIAIVSPRVHLAAPIMIVALRSSIALFWSVSKALAKNRENLWKSQYRRSLQIRRRVVLRPAKPILNVTTGTVVSANFAENHNAKIAA